VSGKRTPPQLTHSRTDWTAEASEIIERCQPSGPCEVVMMFITQATRKITELSPDNIKYQLSK